MGSVQWERKASCCVSLFPCSFVTATLVSSHPRTVRLHYHSHAPYVVLTGTPPTPRVVIDQFVEVISTTHTGDAKALTKNLSLGGVLLKTRSSVPQGAEVTLRLAMPPAITKSGDHPRAAPR